MNDQKNLRIWTKSFPSRLDDFNSNQSDGEIQNGASLWLVDIFSQKHVLGNIKHRNPKNPSKIFLLTKVKQKELTEKKSKKYQKKEAILCSCYLFIIRATSWWKWSPQKLFSFIKTFFPENTLNNIYHNLHVWNQYWIFVRFDKIHKVNEHPRRGILRRDPFEIASQVPHHQSSTWNSRCE